MPFRQQILDVAGTQREPEIEPDRLLDDFGREPVTFVADFLISLTTEPRGNKPESPLQCLRRFATLSRNARAPACVGTRLSSLKVPHCPQQRSLSSLLASCI